VLKRLGTLQRAFKQQFFKLDPAISKSKSYLIGIKKIPSSQEREKYAQSPLALSDVLLPEDGSVPLPQSWPNFLALPDNKSDLARFLWEHTILNAPPNKVVVASGGFVDEREVQ